ncbi:TetR family transcriptional regulator [Saccharopolyspora erythraea NRRL 2338]|uniref:Uncharacterized protein n=2 Tax=Saccharopolyspora erythraea TaxID=1836 RepID=A4FR14_SACEN|nr:TetR/AcrR family transcriptional regulator [Saccharopolyspora erythraea]EQD83915.1 TetR family transcriptional regulator [Saccharopolyspora erythraea D]PFG93091.1 TetR family transcriptional regulator [Saccharopolyspora erythraea NRRL 2338]QRK89962.1 TetR/AcrR family transcriptional regulator [Saccharopolyspora erythraea]CAM06489.1 hypothetical protein SACE_7333 [Saccharopolyspora erythraea NRRL 2338]
MGRLTRAETQERNRAKVLAAARDEFAERGFRDAKVDDIADRAELTRGAVYSNFPGKRALYLAVLAHLAETEPAPSHPQLGRTARDALGALARAWVARLPSGGADSARIGAALVPEILADDRIRQPFAQLMKLNALLLGLALERLRPLDSPVAAPARRSVRLAETVLTTLHGATQMTAAAPGFVEPFDIVSACEQLAELELGDWWAPPTVHPPVRPSDQPWDPPSATDVVRGEPAPLADDGVVAVLGLHRVAAVEEAVRAAPAGTEVTAVLVTGDPGELVPLARLAVAELCGCLRQAFPPPTWPGVRIVCDESGELAAAAGAPVVDDTTETAVHVRSGRITARADGPGACHAVALAETAQHA